MMLADSRKFVGRSFGLSVSVPSPDDPNWPRYYGEPATVIKQFVFAEGSNLLFEGGRLILGHRWDNPSGGWDEEGILGHLLARSREFQSFRPPAPDPASGKIQPALLNLLAWPDAPPPPDLNGVGRLIEDGILSIQQILPAGIDPALLAGVQAAPPSPFHAYARIRALTTMRQRLVDETDFRICIGGSVGKPGRRLPGVVEDALLTCAAGKPLYVSDAFGGASKALAECLLQRRVKFGEEETFYTAPASVDLMLAHAAEHPWASGIEGPSTRGGWNAFDWFQSQLLTDIAARAGLTQDQYCQILAAKDVESAMGWIHVGLRNLVSRKTEPVT